MYQNQFRLKPLRSFVWEVLKLALLQSVWVILGCFRPFGEDFQGMAPVSDEGSLKSGPIELPWMMPGETELGSAGTQPDKG